MNSREALIALNMLPQIGPIRVRRMLEYFESADAILNAAQSRLKKVKGIGDEIATILNHWEKHIDLKKELSDAESRNISILTEKDDQYPETLRHMYDPPLALYVWGEITSADDNAIAIVGSRRTTHYGQQSALSFSRDLACSGLTIISGLARGIDSFAHKGALEVNGRTIAVIGSGLAQLYPPENLKLAERIADGQGAVVSEFPLHHRPDKKTFPMRNRIVAGWSSGVVVVECPEWSGSMITAHLGLEMGKTVYAIPGPIDRPTSAGCNQLIRDGATLVAKADHILQDLEALSLDFKREVHSDTKSTQTLGKDEQCIINLMNKEELLIDDIVHKSKLPIHTVNSTLLQLEMKKLIRQLPGPRYIIR